MIKPNELRLHNFVSWQGQLAFITGIEFHPHNKEYSITVSDAFGRTGVVNMYGIDPIPYGRSQMKDLGVDKYLSPSKEYPYLAIKRVENYAVTDIEIQLKENKFRFKAEGSGYSESNPFLYLHTVQNLYFALTGEEEYLCPHTTK